MSRIAYVNGQYMSHGVAAIHIEDRATQFSDAVYEVFAVLACKIIDADLHYDRLERSLAALRIEMPMSRRALQLVIEDVIIRNRLKDGICYLQISRGSAPRNHAFPKSQRSSLIITAKQLGLAQERLEKMELELLLLQINAGLDGISNQYRYFQMSSRKNRRSKLVHLRHG